MSIEREARAESVRAFLLPHEAPRNANERRANGIISAHRAGYVEGYIAGASRPVTNEEATDVARSVGEILHSDQPITQREWIKRIREAIGAAREVGA